MQACGVYLFRSSRAILLQAGSRDQNDLGLIVDVSGWHDNQVLISRSRHHAAPHVKMGVLTEIIKPVMQLRFGEDQAANAASVDRADNELFGHEHQL